MSLATAGRLNGTPTKLRMAWCDVAGLAGAADA